MPGLYTAMELDEEKAYKAFRKLNEVLLSLQSRETAEKPKEEPEPIITHNDLERVESDKMPELIRPKYRGFLYIRCPECGDVKGFYMKKESDHYHCEGCRRRKSIPKGFGQ